MRTCVRGSAFVEGRPAAYGCHVLACVRAFMGCACALACLLARVRVRLAGVSTRSVRVCPAWAISDIFIIGYYYYRFVMLLLLLAPGYNVVFWV